MTHNVRKTKDHLGHTHIETELRGRRRSKDAPNSLRFLVEIEGVEEYDGRIRSANGMRWQVAR